MYVVQVLLTFLLYLFDWFFDTYLLLQGVEVVYDNTDEQIEDKERTKNDKRNKIDVRDHVAILLWLLVKLRKRRRVLPAKKGRG